MPGDFRLGAERSCLARPILWGASSLLVLLIDGGGDCRVSMSPVSVSVFPLQGPGRAFAPWWRQYSSMRGRADNKMRRDSLI